MSFALTDRLWKRILWIAALALLAYLPAALQLTYYRDDWYYAYDAMVGPAGVFRYMFAEDRPARGPFFELYHALFGIAPTPYHLAMLFWRIAGGAAVTWLFHLLWPRRAAAGLMAGVLFALYPGFTWWVQGIEYQPMVASAALMAASLGLTVLALRTQSIWARAASIAGAVITGFIYLALVEYAAGMEIFRLVLIFFAIEDAGLRTFGRRAAAALRAWLPYLLIPVGFGTWRFLFFTSERKATDLGAQLSGLLADPISTGLHWLMSFLLSFVNVTLAAWVQPLQNYFFSLRLRDQVPAFAFAMAAGALAWLLLRRADVTRARGQGRTEEYWSIVSIWLGLTALVLGILPVIAANRQITFPSFSHYALPASLGLAFLVVGLAELLSNRSARVCAFVGLVFLSVLTLQGLGAAALREERIIANFWHQMAWRAPSIEPGTTLLVYYPGVDYGSDSDVVWGPANFAYYPQAQEKLPVRLSLSAVGPDVDLWNAIQYGNPRESTYRAHTMTIDYSRLLVAVQSAPDTCVRLFNVQRSFYSVDDDISLHWLGDVSRDDLVLSSGEQPQLPKFAFGTEPGRDWCYFFQKASLAMVQQDWRRIAELQKEADRLHLQPNDQVEWLPFLRAQAFLNNLQAVKDIATRVNTEKQYRVNACLFLSGNAAQQFPYSPEMHALVDELFCRP